MLSVFDETSPIEKDFNFHVDNLRNCLGQFFLEYLKQSKATFYDSVYFL